MVPQIVLSGLLALHMTPLTTGLRHTKHRHAAGTVGSQYSIGGCCWLLLAAIGWWMMSWNDQNAHEDDHWNTIRLDHER